jgi:hypothetical protein
MHLASVSPRVVWVTDSCRKVGEIKCLQNSEHTMSLGITDTTTISTVESAKSGFYIMTYIY